MLLWPLPLITVFSFFLVVVEAINFDVIVCAVIYFVAILIVVVVIVIVVIVVVVVVIIHHCRCILYHYFHGLGKSKIMCSCRFQILKTLYGKSTVNFVLGGTKQLKTC